MVYCNAAICSDVITSLPVDMALQWTSVPTLESGVCLSERTWHELPTQGIGFRVGSSANCLKDGSVLLVGGADADGPVSKVHLLDIKNVEWMERSSVKFPPRYEHGSLLCSSRGLLYVFGGARTEGPLGDLWKYDIDKDEWLGVVPGGCAVSPRTIHSPGTHKHLLFVFGGGESGDRPVDAPGPYVFNSEIEEWFKPEISGSGPCPRQGHICACIGGKLFVHGGMAGMTFFNDLHVLDLDSWKWENPKAVGDIPSPRAAHGCAVFDSRICIFGGISLEGSLNDLHLLNTGTLQWSAVETNCAPSPRLDMAMCSIIAPGKSSEDQEHDSLDTIFIFGGVDTSGNAFDDCYVVKL